MLELYGLIIYVITISMLAYRISRIKANQLIALIILLIIGVLLFTYENTNFIVLGAGVIIFDTILAAFGSKINIVFILMGIVYVIIVSVAYVINPAFIAQAIILGAIEGKLTAKERKSKLMIRSKKLEMNRDIIQIIIGIVFLTLFITQKQTHATFELIFLALASFLIVNYASAYSRSKIGTIVNRFERNYTSIGYGAIWLAIGSLLPVSILHQPGILIISAAIFFGDSLATIVGLNLKKIPLPHNKEKSLFGFLAYFAVVFVASYTFIGWYALPIALIAALVESMPIHIDDNFDVALALTVLFILGNLFI